MTARSIKRSYAAIAKTHRSPPRNPSWQTPRDALVTVPRRPRHSEYLDGAFQRLPHAPGQGNADEGPEQRGPGVEPAEPDAIGARGTRCPRGCRCRLQLGDLGIAHVPFLI